jgi:hypothetical protein
MEIPPGGQVVERNMPGLWIPGLAILGGTYLATAAGGAAVREGTLDGDRYRAAPRLYIPVVGPFLYLPEATQPGRPFVVMSGLLQVGGLAMFILGLVIKRKHLVYYAEGPAGRPLALSAASTPGGAGLQIAF